MKTTEIIESYINGNIEAAKKAANARSEIALYECLKDDFGYSANKARLTAAHLKGVDCWQEACDAK